MSKNIIQTATEVGIAILIFMFFVGFSIAVFLELIVGTS